MTTIHPPAESIQLSISFGSFSICPNSTYAVDGSGGLYTSDKRLRRCGWAVVQVSWDTHDMPRIIAARAGNLPKAVLSISKAEVFAVLYLL